MVCESKALETDHERFIVDRLNAMRKARGWTVTELAKRSKMDPSHLGKVFRHERGLRADEFLRASLALNATKVTAFVPEDLFRELLEPNMLTPDGKPIL